MHRVMTMFPNREAEGRVALLTAGGGQDLLTIAAILARSRGVELLLLDLVTIAADARYGAATGEARRRREELEELGRRAQGQGRSRVRLTQAPVQTIRDTILEEKVGLLVGGWQAD